MAKDKINSVNADENKIILVFDKDCPVCNKYCNSLSIKRQQGELEIINARQASKIMDELSRQGVDIDQGIAVKIHNKLFYGAQALHVLALISDRSNVFNKVNYWLFRHKWFVSAIYPVLRFARSIVLRILGKSKINNLNKF